MASQQTTLPTRLLSNGKSTPIKYLCNFHDASDDASCNADSQSDTTRDWTFTMTSAFVWGGCVGLSTHAVEKKEDVDSAGRLQTPSIQSHVRTPAECERRAANIVHGQCYYRTESQEHGLKFMFFLRCSYMPEFWLNFQLSASRLATVSRSSPRTIGYRLPLGAHGCWEGKNAEAGTDGTEDIAWSFAEILLVPQSGSIDVVVSSGTTTLVVPDDIIRAADASMALLFSPSGVAHTPPDFTNHTWPFPLPTNIPRGSTVEKPGIPCSHLRIQANPVAPLNSSS